MPAVCWISTDDYSNENKHIHGFVVEPIQDQPSGSSSVNPIITNNAGKILREMVLCDTCRETALREANCEHADTKTASPKSAVLHDSTNCDANPKTVSPEPAALRDSTNSDVIRNLEAAGAGEKPEDGVA